MTSPTTRIILGAPPDRTLADDATETAVSASVAALKHRMGIPGGVDVDVVQQREWSLAINGEPVDDGGRALLFAGAAARNCQVADEALVDEVMIPAWVSMVLSFDPRPLVDEAVAATLWAGSGQPDPVHPRWWMSLLKRTVWLGGSLAEGIAPQQLGGVLPESSTDAEWLAETVLARQVRPLTISTSIDAMPRLRECVEGNRRGERLERSVIDALDTLGVLVPAVTFDVDDQVAPGCAEVRLGPLVLSVVALSPAGEFVALLGDAWSIEVVGEGGPYESPFAGWSATRVLVGSDQERDAREQLLCDSVDLLVAAAAEGLLLCPERLPDYLGVEHLLSQLFDHVGSGHTVWFTRHLLGSEQVLVVVRGLLARERSLTELPAVLRDLLARVDGPPVGRSDFLASLDVALA